MSTAEDINPPIAVPATLPEWRQRFDSVAWEEEQREFRERQVERQVGAIIAEGPERAIIIGDWDGVFSRVEIDGVEGSNWSVLRRHMTQEGLERHRALFKQYHPLEMEGRLTPRDSRNWQADAHACLAGASLRDILDDVPAHVQLRTGSAEFVETGRQAGVRVHVRSTGFREVIGTVAATHGVELDHVDANAFQTDDSPARIITGVDHGSFTHSLGKRRHDHRRVAGGEDRHNVVVLGDRPHDARMVPLAHAKRLLAVQVDDGRAEVIRAIGTEGYANQRRIFAEAGYSLIAVPPGLVAVTGLVEAIARSGR